MARPTYTPTQDERQRIREFIDENTGFQHKGMRKRDYKPAIYPRGITTFSECVGLTRATVSKALNGHPTSRRTWQKIVSEVNVYVREDDLVKELARMRGVPMRKIKEALAQVA